MVEQNMEDIEKEYLTLEKKYGLPSFKSLVKEFDVEKVSEKSKGILLKDIRHVMEEKISSYLSFFEMLINPSSPPMFVFSFLKNLNDDAKKEIQECYKELSRMQIMIIKTDVLFKEESEANAIKTIFDKWQIVGKKTFDLVDLFEKEFEKSIETKGKSYFG